MEKLLDENVANPIFARPQERYPFSGKKQNGSVVQLVRMPPCHGGGRGFESRPVRTNNKRLTWIISPNLKCPVINYRVFFLQRVNNNNPLPVKDKTSVSV